MREKLGDGNEIVEKRRKKQGTKKGENKRGKKKTPKIMRCLAVVSTGITRNVHRYPKQYTAAKIKNLTMDERKLGRAQTQGSSRTKKN